MTVPPYDWVTALLAILIVASVQRASIGVLLSVGHVKAHRGLHLALVPLR